MDLIEKCPICGCTSFWNASGREETHWHCTRCDNKFEKASFIKERKESFEKYGFLVPEFECEILKKYHTYIVGAVKSDADRWIGITWDKSGNVVIGLKQYKLTLKEKEWYEDIKNFPSLMFSFFSNKSFIAIGYKNGNFITSDNEIFDKNDSKKIELSDIHINKLK